MIKCEVVNGDKAVAVQKRAGIGEIQQGWETIFCEVKRQIGLLP
jgi:hypothetical protein